MTAQENIFFALIRSELSQQKLTEQEKKLLSAIAASDGKDTVVIYVENPRAMKQLGANQTVHGDEALLKQLEELFVEENVKLM